MPNFVEMLVTTALMVALDRYRGNMHDFFRRVGDIINDKIEGTKTQIDDTAKAELVAALKEAFIPELEVEGTDA